MIQIVKLINKGYRLYQNNSSNKLKNVILKQSFQTTYILQNEKENKELIIKDFFENVENKNKNTFLEMINIYKNRSVHRRGHVEFIYSALKHLEEFGVDEDLEVYKALIDVLPKGKMVPQNMFQVEFQHYPKQQQCIIDLLGYLEDRGICPDEEMEDILVNIFGSSGFPVRKYWRMMYWMPKFKNLSPWLLPKKLPNDALELAKLAIERMTSDVDLKTKINVYDSKNIEDSIDKTWIVSGQSSKQIELLNKRPKDMPVFVEGPFLIWLRKHSISYFILRADFIPDKNEIVEDEDDISNLKAPWFAKTTIKQKALASPRSIHEQSDGVILAVCATGTSTKDSLLSWIRLLEKDGNSALATLPVVFKFYQPVKDIVVIDQTNSKDIQ